MGKTIRAMKRIAEIRQNREKRYIKQRLNQSKEMRKKQIEIEIKQHIDLLAAPSSKNSKEIKEKILQKLNKKEAVMEED